MLFIRTQKMKVKTTNKQKWKIPFFFYTKHFVTEEFKQVWLNNKVLKPGEPLWSFHFYKDKCFFHPLAYAHTCFGLVVIQKCNMNQVSLVSSHLKAIFLWVCTVWVTSRLYRNKDSKDCHLQGNSTAERVLMWTPTLVFFSRIIYDTAI